MTRDPIAEISVDHEGRLRVRPESAAFPHVYREAMEVTWETATRSLMAPAPEEWTHARWFQQILEAARQQGVELFVADTTRWTNADQLKTAVADPSASTALGRL